MTTFQLISIALQSALVTLLLIPPVMVRARLGQQMERVPGHGMKAWALALPLVVGTCLPPVWNGLIDVIGSLFLSTDGRVGSWLLIVSFPMLGALLLIGWADGLTAAQARFTLPLVVGGFCAFVYGVPLLAVIPSLFSLGMLLFGFAIGVGGCVAMNRMPRPDRTPTLAWLVLSALPFAAWLPSGIGGTPPGVLVVVSACAFASALIVALAAHSPFALALGPAGRAIIALGTGLMNFWLLTENLSEVPMPGEWGDVVLPVSVLLNWLALRWLWADSMPAIRERRALEQAALGERATESDASAPSPN